MQMESLRDVLRTTTEDIAKNYELLRDKLNKQNVQTSLQDLWDIAVIIGDIKAAAAKAETLVQAIRQLH